MVSRRRECQETVETGVLKCECSSVQLSNESARSRCVNHRGINFALFTTPDSFSFSPTLGT